MRGSCSFCCVLVAIVTFLLSADARLWAQKQYTPNHPDVEKMVRKGLSSMRSNVPKSIDRRVLAALTVVETSKRYDSVVPVDDPLVSTVVEEVIEEIESGKLQAAREVYYPALALILLCDCGDDKYADQIKIIIENIISRQEPNGGLVYLSDKGSGKGDTSQTQYGALGLWVAYKHGFSMPLDSLKKMLEFYMDTNQGNGSWYYTYNNGQGAGDFYLSIHAASLGTTYLLADFLQLNPKSSRRKTNSAQQDAIAEAVELGTGLPPSVSIYVPPKDGEDPNSVQRGKSGPLVRVDMGSLANTKRSGNNYLDKNFTIGYDYWGYYYLYALERYAFFREKAEGSVREIPDWYDQGVILLRGLQEEDGGFAKLGRNNEQNTFTRTCFAILFLVRSSEVLILPSGEGNLNGGVGLKSNVRLDLVDGKIKSFDVINGLDDVLQLLDGGDVDEQQFELIQDSLAKSISQLGTDNKRTRREKLNYLRGFVSDRNYFKRLIAVKLLSRQQNMDSVPALIYALGDPDKRICLEAHNGLRLISRKLDSIRVPDNASHADYQNIKKQWTDWFLQIRPGAELLD